ncbi:hypothetical protein AgCh_020371 [Apium graveolens]
MNTDASSILVQPAAQRGFSRCIIASDSDLISDNLPGNHSFIHNGEIFGNIKPGRGLRQVPNTGRLEREVVCQKLGIREVQDPGHYLGMPMCIGRQKGQTFQFVKDKIKQKLQGWRSKGICKPGKVTLLKTAAQSVPNFWMNLFLIPESVCDDIERLMNSYWWENGAGSTPGIRWRSWKRLCAVKEGGGLGMKELYKFNIAMLAKQGWRLVNNVNPLVSSLMKARYYPKEDFLNAAMGSNPSFMWRSILTAQDLLKHGCRRRIGNGDRTRIWKVPWLPDVDNGYLSTDMPLELQNATVSGLMEIDHRRWDEEVISDLCNDRDKELILSIPLSMGTREDGWYWLLDPKGNFTVRSGYRFLQGEQPKPYAKFWRKMWSLRLPGKVLNLVWRACCGCLPTAMALTNKRVEINKICPWCHQAEETDIHVFFECNFARSMWLCFGLRDAMQVSRGEGIMNILQRIFDTLSQEKCTLIGIVCWSLWYRRNKWVWDKVNKSVHGMMKEAMAMLQDWRDAQDVTQQRGLNQSGTVINKWQKPPLDGLKLIWTQLREAEAMALKEAMQWALVNGWKTCIFESDAKMVVDAVHSVAGNSPFYFIVRDCVNLFRHFDEVQVCHIRRSANGVAHVLAQAARSMSDLVQEWHVVLPEFISHVIVADMDLGKLEVIIVKAMASGKDSADKKYAFGKGWDTGKMLQLCIYDRMKKKGLHNAAETFAKEVNLAMVEYVNPKERF